MKQSADRRRQAANGRWRRRGTGGLGVLAIWLLLDGWAQARPPRKAAVSAAAVAAQRVGSGVLALASREFATARREFEAAYRLTPTPELLYQLGVVASAEGKPVEAHDLLRRYLAAATGDPSSSRRSDAQRLLLQPLPPTAEVRLRGDAGGLLLVDERLTGQLPLARPLLLTAGTHQLRLESAAGQAAGTVELRPGTALEVTATLATGSLQSTPLPTVLTLDAASPERALGAELSPLLSTLLGQKRVAVIDPPSGSQLRSSCWDERSCLLELGLLKSAPDWLLYAERPPTAAGPKLRLSLLDVAGATLLGSVERPCEPCTAATAQPLLDELLNQLLATAVEQSPGRLVVRATPAEVELELDGWKLGRPPLDRPLRAGRHELVLRAPDYVLERRPLLVVAGQPLTVEATLAPLPPPIQAPTFRREERWQRPPRPLARLLGGSAAVVGGLSLLGLGAYALSVNGSCIDPPSGLAQVCPSLYATTGIGSGLVVGGALLAIGGAIVIALPTPRQRVEVLVPVTPPPPAAKRK